VRARLDELAGKGFGAAIIDAVFDSDLETIGEVALDHRLSVGASGFGLGLARALVASGKVKAHASSAVSGAPVGGAAACLAGSCSQATLQQIARAEAVMPVLHLDPDRAVAGNEEARRALAWALERLKHGPVLIASSSTPDQVAALQARHGRDAAGHAIEQAMADIAEGLVLSGIRRLVVAGGETSGAVVDRLRIPGFLVGAEIAAGVPVLRAVGAKGGEVGGEMLLALKSGNFGGPEFFSDALKLMR
jgi:3-dehydrotetronate 4-kinase